ncbi:MAG: NAD(P)/FAD-dependent oxidoreductase [Bacteroidetes bacterium]|nr:NAD(P)/FAD-dependent oxidoreductase [Bacteroidota bacterium]HET6245127.1 NAD(P)/FAD-dependent oxidoreductase [Bacteroidia bacterium]
MKNYDLCVVGGGPTGYAAAMRAIDFGKKVLLIEKSRLGGAGVYDGALASKAMWEYSEKIKTVREIAGNGITEKLTYREINKTVNEAIFERKFQLSCHLRILQEKNGFVNYIKGTGKLISANEVEITKENGTIETIWAENILIATGSRPRKLPNIPVDEKIILTSDGIHHLEDFPKSIVILGAGIIGCEYATIFSNFGRTKVYMIDRADRILPFEDEDVAKVVEENFRKNGVTVHNEAKLERMAIVDGKVEYEISHKDGRREIIKVEKALLSIGRVPNVEGIGLENAGVKLTKAGYIHETDTLTGIPNIYAAGDVSGRLALVNVGEREARHAVVRMFDGPIPPIIYDNISTIMFLNPEIAVVGMNEQEAQSKGITYKLVKYDYSCIARAIAMRKTTGFFKILVTNDKHMKILGMRAVGEHASSAIQAVALLISMNKGIDEITNLMHPHPSIIEGIQECFRMLKGKSIFKASVFKDKLQCYRCENGVCSPL